VEIYKIYSNESRNIQILNSPSSSGSFGEELKIYDDVAVISTVSISGKGSISVYRHTSTEPPVFVQTKNYSLGINADEFGSSIDFYKVSSVIGAPKSKEGKFLFAGSAYFYSPNFMQINETNP